jgi:hypothetical protein
VLVTNPPITTAMYGNICMASGHQASQKLFLDGLGRRPSCMVSWAVPTASVFSLHAADRENRTVPETLILCLVLALPSEHDKARTLNGCGAVFAGTRSTTAVSLEFWFCNDSCGHSTLQQTPSKVGVTHLSKQQSFLVTSAMCSLPSRKVVRTRTRQGTLS